MKQIHYISKSESEKLLKYFEKNPKYTVIILLMLDAGLRVTESVTLQFKNFDFKNRTFTIYSLKSRKNKSRVLPISDRLYQAISTYLQSYPNTVEPDSYLFPSYGKEPYLDRRTVWRVLKRAGNKLYIPNLHPHTLRHTFATHHLSAGSTLEEIKTMLGHQSYDTTLIYASIPTKKLKQRVNQVTSKKPNFLQKLFSRKRKTKLINLNFTSSYFTIGRNEELQKLESNANKGINTVIIGPTGVGKSHLINNINSDKPILHLDNGESIKKSLASILLYLYKDKKTVLSVLWKDFTDTEFKKRINRETTIYLCDTIISSVKPQEYLLIIDDITKLTPTGKKIIERLKDTFVIICCARQIKANDTSFLWNFEILKLKPLNRNHSLQLINQLSSGLQVENPELFRNHIYEQTNGNPRAITEMIDRYRKEPFLDTQTIREIKHIGALEEFDMTFLILLVLGIITALRYMSRELDEPALRFIGSIGLILLIVTRPLFTKFKRKFL